MLPLLTPQKVKCFRVRFRFQLLSSTCFRFHKNLTVFTTSASTSQNKLIQTERILTFHFVQDINTILDWTKYFVNEAQAFIAVIEPIRNFVSRFDRQKIKLFSGRPVDSFITRLTTTVRSVVKLYLTKIFSAMLLYL